MNLPEYERRKRDRAAFEKGRLEGWDQALWFLVGLAIIGYVLFG